MTTKEPNTCLRGGPTHHTGHGLRLWYAEDTEATVKLQNGNCYDHFAETPERVHHEGRELRVFAWTHRTYVAE